MRAPADKTNENALFAQNNIFSFTLVFVIVNQSACIWVVHYLKSIVHTDNKTNCKWTQLNYVPN